MSELPAWNVDVLRRLKRVPLWPSLSGALPPDRPRPNTWATAWV